MASKIEQLCDILTNIKDKYEHWNALFGLLGPDIEQIVDKLNIDFNETDVLKQKNILKYMIEHYDNPEKQFSKIKWFVHKICFHGDFETIKMLIDKGINLEEEDGSKWRPIHFICRYQNFDTIKYIIDKGVDLEAENNTKCRPIHYILYYQKYDTIKSLISNYSFDINSINSDNCNALHYACRCQNSEIIKLIINMGAKKDLRIIKFNNNEDTFLPVHYMFKYNTLETIKETIGLFTYDAKCMEYLVSRFNLDMNVAVMVSIFNCRF